MTIVLFTDGYTIPFMPGRASSLKLLPLCLHPFSSSSLSKDDCGESE